MNLEGAKGLPGVEEEIALLRILLRKMAQEGDVEAARRNIETLCRALRVQYVLGGHSTEGLAGSLAQVPDELGNELGMTA